MARVLAISTDLLLASKVEAMLSAAGHQVTLAPSVPEQLKDVDLLVADLDTEDPQALAKLPIPVLGYYSHVNAETKKASEAAGIALAIPRSRMARELPDLAAKLLT